MRAKKRDKKCELYLSTFFLLVQMFNDSRTFNRTAFDSVSMSLKSFSLILCLCDTILCSAMPRYCECKRDCLALFSRASCLLDVNSPTIGSSSFVNGQLLVVVAFVFRRISNSATSEVVSRKIELDFFLLL